MFGSCVWKNMLNLITMLSAAQRGPALPINIMPDRIFRALAADTYVPRHIGPRLF